MIDHEMQHAGHSVLWWNVKVLCGAALIGLMVERYALGLLPALGAPLVLPGQILVGVGGAVFVMHYLINRARTRVISAPEALVTDGGLYRYIRHPMYLADAIMYFGFLLLAPNYLGFGIYLLALVALYRQAREEDRFIATRFPENHARWREMTGLFTPRIRVFGRSP